MESVVAMPSADDRSIESLLARATDAQTVVGDPRASRQWFERAYDLAEKAGDTRAMAVAVLGQGGLRVHEQRTAAGEVMLSRMRRLQPNFDPLSSIGLQIRARLAAESDYRIGKHTAILGVLEEATRAASPVARASALSLAHHCLLGPGLGHAELRRRLAAELIEESTRTRRRSDLLMGMLWQTLNLLIDGDRDVERRFGELKTFLAVQNHLAVGYLAGVIEVTLAIRAGRLEPAEAQAQDCLDAGTAIEDIDATGFHAGHLIAIRWYQGRLAELLPMLGALVHSPTLRGVDNSLFAALAAAAAAAGDRLTAAGAVAHLCGRDLAELPQSSSWLPTMFGIAEAAYLLHDTDTSERVYELLIPYADLPVVSSLGALCLGSAQHVLGVAALTTGDLGKAVAHFEAAIRDNLALGHRPALIVSQARYAQALTRRRESGDVALAREALASADHDASALSMPVPNYVEGRRGEQGPATCTRNGQQWLVQFGHRSVSLPHSVGMSYLAILLANPGQDIPAVDLAAGLSTLQSATTPGQPVLDRVAINRYRHRIEELHGRLAELKSDDRPDLAAEAVAERDWLLAELSTATGIVGRTRTFSNEHERARLAVGKAIRRTIAAISRIDAVLGGHLQNNLHTGARCSYRPE
jgi:hypothetical protein